MDSENVFSFSSNFVKITEPFVWSNLPDPYHISRIAPEILIYTKPSDSIFQSRPSLIINSTHSPERAVQLWRENSDLSNIERFVVIAHGFLNDKRESWMHELKDSILKTDTRVKQAVAILGWGWGAKWVVITPAIIYHPYAQASANCLETGRWLGRFLKRFRLTFPDIKTYGIGHSLGSHLMGWAGRTAQGGLDRITGLDPAGPYFRLLNNDKRLTVSDADLVDVIHTDGRGKRFWWTGLGTLTPAGLLDFYPNFGWQQPRNDHKSSVKPAQFASWDVDQQEENELKAWPKEKLHTPIMAKLNAPELFTHDEKQLADAEKIKFLGFNESPFGSFSKLTRIMIAPLIIPFIIMMDFIVIFLVLLDKFNWPWDSHMRAIDYFHFSVENQHAFRTNLRLDRTPGITRAVHRIRATKDFCPGNELRAAMGYWCDWFMKQQNGNSKPEAETKSGYDVFAGNYYVHTNARHPWS